MKRLFGAFILALVLAGFIPVKAEGHSDFCYAVEMCDWEYGTECPPGTYINSKMEVWMCSCDQNGNCGWTFLYYWIL